MVRGARANGYAAAALVVADAAPDLAAGLQVAARALDDGAAATALDRLVTVSAAYAEAVCTVSRSPGKTRWRTTVPPGYATAQNTRPTGFSSEPPVGPAI